MIRTAKCLLQLSFLSESDLYRFIRRASRTSGVLSSSIKLKSKCYLMLKLSKRSLPRKGGSSKLNHKIKRKQADISQILPFALTIFCESLYKIAFREELDRQLNGFREKALELDKEKHDFEQRRILEQNN